MSNDGTGLSVQNLDGTRPAVQIVNTPATAKGLPALAVYQGDSTGAAIATTGNVTVTGSLTVTGAATLAGQVTANPDLLTHPVTALAATMPLNRATAAQGAMTSGIVYLMSIGMPAGLTVSNCTMFTNTTAKTGGTHGWYVLTDSSRNVVAVTADQTDAATVWGATSTGYTLAFTAPYTTTYTGRYYVGVMVAQSAGTNPTFSGAATTTGGIVAGTGVTNALALAGSSSTGQTTPPALAAQLTSVTPGATFLTYAFLT